MAIASTLTRVVLEPASQAFVEATVTPPFLYELTPDEARKVLDDVQAAPIDKLPVDEHWITVPADVGDVRGAHRAPGGRRGHAAGDPVHARRWLGARNAATHDRLVRASWRSASGQRSPSSRRPFSGGALPRRLEQGDAVARHIMQMGAAHGATLTGWPTPATPSGRHDRRADADGGRARRRALRLPGNVLPRHRRGDGHALLPAVRRGLLPDGEGDGVVLVRLRA